MTPQKVTIMGLGLFGGGLGAARYFSRLGCDVTVTDMKSEDDLRPSVEQLADLPVELHLGEHRDEDFTQADIVVASPAVPRASRYIELARSAGVRLDTEVSLFIKQCPAPIIGITGSNGKTTTTSMIGSILGEGTRRVHVGGNIGGSLLDTLHEIGPDDIVVLELSSFQLEWLGEAGLSPNIAVVTNINPNHLDRHGTMENYIAAKKNIIANLDTEGCAVLAYDDPVLAQWSEDVNGRCLGFSATVEPPQGAFVRDGRIMCRKDGCETDLAGVDVIRVPGKHNIANALAAVAACVAVGADAGMVAGGLSKFTGIRHRLEFICERNGVSYYNDSKATTPEAAMAALAAFEHPVIIAGGYDKKVSLQGFAEKIFNSSGGAILLGQTADAIAAHLDGYSRAGFAWARAADLPEAVAKATQMAGEGGVVLLSPACASYDMFTNYEERGDLFRDLCLAL